MVDRLKNAVGAFVFVIKGNFMHLKTLFETNKNGKKGKGNKIGIGRKCEYVIKKTPFFVLLKGDLSGNTV